MFISYLASTANEQTTKKTIGPNDVLNALREMELGGIMGLEREGGRLERELEAWENVVKGKRKGYREKVKGRQSGTGMEGDEPESKRVRVDSAEEEMGGLNGEGSHDGEEHRHPKTMFSDDEGAENGFHEENENGNDNDADATESDGNGEEDEEEADEVRGDEDTLDDYGPDEQLRRDILRNGDDAGGTEDESD